MVVGAEHSREQHGFPPPTGSCPKGNTSIYCRSFVLFQSRSRRSRVKKRWGGRKKEKPKKKSMQWALENTFPPNTVKQLYSNKRKKRERKYIHRCGIRRQLFRFKNNTHHQKVLFYLIPQPGSSQAHVQMSGWQLVPGHQSRSISMLYGAGVTRWGTNLQSPIDSQTLSLPVAPLYPMGPLSLTGNHWLPRLICCC